MSSGLSMISILVHGVLLSLSELHMDGLVQERRNSSVLAMELRLSRTNPSICAGNHTILRHVN